MSYYEKKLYERKLFMTERAKKIAEYQWRLSQLDPTSDRYEKLYEEYIKFLNSK